MKETLQLSGETEEDLLLGTALVPGSLSDAG